MQTSTKNNFRLFIRLTWHCVFGVKVSHSLLFVKVTFIECVLRGRQTCASRTLQPEKNKRWSGEKLITRNDEGEGFVQSLEQNKLKCSFAVSFNKSRFSDAHSGIVWHLPFSVSIISSNTTGIRMMFAVHNIRNIAVECVTKAVPPPIFGLSSLHITKHEYITIL